MIRKIIILSTLCLLILVSSLFAQRKGPRALIVETSYDFGYIPQNISVSHTYWVNNLGTSDLRIFEVKPGCGCTKAPLITNSAIPGDSLPIELVFSSGKRKRVQNKQTAVTCNDYTKKSFNLRLTAYVYEEADSSLPIIFETPYINVMEDSWDNNLLVKFTNISDENFKVKLIDYPKDIFNVKLPAGVISPGKTVEINVKIPFDKESKGFSKSFTFELTDKQKTRFTVPVRLSLAPKKKAS